MKLTEASHGQIPSIIEIYLIFSYVQTEWPINCTIKFQQICKESWDTVNVPWVHMRSVLNPFYFYKIKSMLLFTKRVHSIHKTFICLITYICVLKQWNRKTKLFDLQRQLWLISALSKLILSVISYCSRK